MTTLRMKGKLTIFISLLVAGLLTLLPLPIWAESFRPAWLLLVVLFWVNYLPHRMGLFTAWFCGLVLDVINGTLLGENALIFLVLAYLSMKLHKQFQMFSILGQSTIIFLLLFLNQILLFWFQGLQGLSVSITWFLACPLVGGILWPWLALVLLDCMKRYRIN